MNDRWGLLLKLHCILMITGCRRRSWCFLFIISIIAIVVQCITGGSVSWNHNREWMSHRPQQIRGNSDNKKSFTKKVYIDWDTAPSLASSSNTNKDKNCNGSTTRTGRRNDITNTSKRLFTIKDIRIPFNQQKRDAKSKNSSSSIHTSGSSDTSDGRHVISNNDDHDPAIQIPTRLGGLCRAFRNVLINVNSNNNDDYANTVTVTDIDVPLLINACYHCAQSMRDVGHVTSAKDLYQNTKKVETFSKNMPSDVQRYMKELLAYEKSTGIHPNNGKMLLKDPSIAISLLWMRRHVSFQCELFRLLLANDQDQRSTVETTLLAYQRKLEPYHGWALQRISKTAIQITTPANKQSILAQLGGFNVTTATAPSSTTETATQTVAPTMNKKSKRYMASAIDASIPARSSAQNHHDNDIIVPTKRRIKQRYFISLLNKAHLVSTKLDNTSPNDERLSSSEASPSSSTGGVPTFGHKEEDATRRDMKHLIQIWEPLLEQWTKTFLELELEDYRRV